MQAKDYNTYEADSFSFDESADDGADEINDIMNEIESLQRELDDPEDSVAEAKAAKPHLRAVPDPGRPSGAGAGRGGIFPRRADVSCARP